MRMIYILAAAAMYGAMTSLVWWGLDSIFADMAGFHRSNYWDVGSAATAGVAWALIIFTRSRGVAQPG